MTPESPQNRLFSLWLLIPILALAISLIIAQRFGGHLLGLVTDSAVTKRVIPPPCQLNRDECQFSFTTIGTSEALWSFSISPRPIPVSAPLTLRLIPSQPAQQAPTTAWVDLTGEDMDMGLIRIPLQQSPDGSWTGTGSLPVCVTGVMRWRAQISLQIAQTTFQTEWVFRAPDSGKRH
jgi:hypothetical protein